MDIIKNNPIKVGIAFLLIVTVNIVGWYLFLTWRPDPSLNLPTLTPVLETEAPPTVTATEGSPEENENTSETATPTNTAAPEYTATLEPVCGGPNYMNVLITGVAPNMMYGLADAIRVVRVDFQHQKVTVLSFPRDLWVDIPVSVPGKSQDITPGKINQAYFYGTEGMGYYSGPGNGSGLLAKTLLEDFGLRIDHYIAASVDSFKAGIDAIGGIHVCFGDPVYKKRMDPKTGVEYPVEYIKSGCHQIDGEQAEFAVRQRIKIGDEGRISRQTVILKAIAAKLITPSTLKNLPDIVNRMKQYYELDLSPAEISQLLCLAGKIDPKEDIVYVDIPEEMINAEWRKNIDGQNTSVLIVDQEEFRQLMTDFQQGVWP
jgi:LCP family protein required for cell wall assembly